MNAIAPMAEASLPTWMRTSKKFAPIRCGLDIARQRPSARFGTQIDLEGVDSGAALDDGSFSLHSTCVDGWKGKRALMEESLCDTASSAAHTGLSNPGWRDPRCPTS